MARHTMIRIIDISQLHSDSFFGSAATIVSYLQSVVNFNTNDKAVKSLLSCLLLAMAFTLIMLYLTLHTGVSSLDLFYILVLIYGEYMT
jgi:hypothetical protein